ncbi:thioredoxin domain-containing protein [Desulfohalobium retbaense]|uniref:Spermatogenesis-associated protein 20-like TRX domain-containing protein n=1 Tax=Desulfohalobium retbaense (strain ATCC 49708 / DSM 5692 / JCM 16813 / HR100) TaxID=485915 RepID=C8X2F1_DESRD|nr:thioredoxin domain-containing protein [Desulfohalobium retbaense]ACV68598.1 protein of unknown function DUF255 [Desulfohalobium retbaense DSM 5692]
MSQTLVNRLAESGSPYLEQHAGNPVAWQPWDDQALATAHRLQRPIFLSIGYATCHWCHVMERECFEDTEVAHILNTVCVPIKVDREERPDLDTFYMSCCQALSGRGGWPLNLFLTPDGRPFFAATYIPKQSRFSQPGLLDLLVSVQEDWVRNREQIEQSATRLVSHIHDLFSDSSGPLPENAIFEQAVQELRQNHDDDFGGFGKAPKFPTPHVLLFLLRLYDLSQDRSLLNMVDSTLEAICRGGIRDHIGGGFHRYSTDRAWHLPHFEKMLYDQALLLMALAEGHARTRRDLFRREAVAVAEYMLERLHDGDGGLYCGEDADTEGEEGAFYQWTETELEAALPPDTFRVVQTVAGIRSDGNILDEATRQRTGKNVLARVADTADAAERLGLSEEQVRLEWHRAMATLGGLRAQRPQPFLDDKQLTSWNGLAVAALARSGILLGEEHLIAAARETADWVLETMQPEPGRLWHRARNRHAGIPGFLEDYAYFIWGLLELVQTSEGQDYRRIALRLADTVLSEFADLKEGGFFQTHAAAQEPLLRLKKVFDDALPSENAVMLYNLVRLYGSGPTNDCARKHLRGVSGIVRQHPQGAVFTLFAASFLRPLEGHGTWREK